VSKEEGKRLCAVIPLSTSLQLSNSSRTTTPMHLPPKECSLVTTFGLACSLKDIKPSLFCISSLLSHSSSGSANSLSIKTLKRNKHGFGLSESSRYSDIFPKIRAVRLHVASNLSETRFMDCFAPAETSNVHTDSDSKKQIQIRHGISSASTAYPKLLSYHHILQIEQTSTAIQDGVTQQRCACVLSPTPHQINVLSKRKARKTPADLPLARNLTFWGLISKSHERIPCLPENLRVRFP
jgi:hypothetical protein